MTPIGYVYLTTCLVNGKIYIGQHKLITKARVKNYIGSGGKHFKYAIKKHGRENFKRRILKLCYSETQLNVWEYYFTKKLNPNLDSKIGYNRCFGNVHVCGNRNPSTHPEVRRKISETVNLNYKNNPELKMKCARHGASHHMFGKHQSDEIKKKISDSKKGEFTGDKHWNYGQHRSEETKNKISKANILYAKHHKEELSNRMKGKLAKEKHPLWGKHHSEETKNKIRLSRKSYNKENHPIWGKMRINNGIINKLIPKTELIPKGWRKGILWVNKIIPGSVNNITIKKQKTLIK